MNTWEYLRIFNLICTFLCFDNTYIMGAGASTSAGVNAEQAKEFLGDKYVKQIFSAETQCEEIGLSTRALLRMPCLRILLYSLLASVV